jgi:hypothetical protein
MECLELGREICVGRVVCGSLLDWAGSEDYWDDGAEGAEKGGDFGPGGGDDARVPSTDYADGRRLRHKGKVISARKCNRCAELGKSVKSVDQITQMDTDD